MRESIELQGHICFLSETSLQELEGNLERLKKMVTHARADAWILYAADQKVLEWFAKNKTPTFCIGGYMPEHPLPHTRADAVYGFQDAIRDFINHGHRRIVFIAPKVMRNPKPSRGSRAFLDMLKSNGLAVSDFNLPDRDESPDGLRILLDRLFSITPPTGLLTFEPGHALGIISFCSQRGIRIPEDVSLFCAMPDPICEALPDEVFPHRKSL